MNRILTIMTIMAAMAFHWLSASAQSLPEEITGSRRSAVVKELAEGYADWKSVQLDGKITSLNFFIKPSVKVFMKRGESLMMSVRVPLKGEVARLEADTDSVLVVNKLKNIYVHESLEQVSRIADVTIADLQDVFLGRAFIAGKGTIAKKDVRKVELYEDEDGYLVVPSGQPDDSIVRYGFNVMADGRVKLLMLSSPFDDFVGNIGYTYHGGGYEMELLVERKAKNFSFAVDFDAPQWGAKGFRPIETGRGLRQVSLREFINQLKF